MDTGGDDVGIVGVYVCAPDCFPAGDFFATGGIEVDRRDLDGVSAVLLVCEVGEGFGCAGEAPI